MQYIIGVFLSLFLAVLIFTKKGRNLADVILGCWMLVIGIHILGYYTFVSSLIYEYPALTWLNLPYVFLHGPLLYLYTKALTNPELFRSKLWLSHFILPLLMLFSTFPVMFLPENERLMVYKNNGEGYESYLFDWTTLLVISGVVYIILTGVLLYHHQKRILNQFSYQEKINLNWLKFLLFGMGITWAIIIFGSSDNWIFSTSSFFLVFIGFFGIKQAGIFTEQHVEPAIVEERAAEVITKEDPGIERKKYAKSSLNEDTARGLQHRLRVLMENDRVFAEPELTLTDLANRLQIHPNYLSQVINDMEGVNFYDYINTLRVEEFKRLVSLPESQKFTFLSLAYECGFNSKTAFNRYFKKATGYSPSEYLKSLQ